MSIEEKWWLQLSAEVKSGDGEVTDISTVPQLLTIDQLAERFGTTVRHVRRLVAERRVPYLKVGRLVRFDPDAIRDWLDLARGKPDPVRAARP